MRPFLLGTIALAWICACDPDGRDTLPALTEDEAQRLDALGYLDFAPEAAPDEPSGVVARDSQHSWAGYDLLTFPVLSRAELVDAEGRVVRSWSGAPGRWERAALTPDGDLLVVAAEDVGTWPGGKPRRRRALLRLGWDDALAWKRWLPVHHYAEELPDGRLGTLTSRPRTIPERFGDVEVLDNGLAILSPDGEEIQQESSLHDMLAARPDLFAFREVRDGKGGLEMDFLHANFFQWMPGGALAERDALYAPSNVVVTMRTQDTVAVFDWAKGEVIWAWGQGEVVGPHDTRVLSNGNFLVFDNRSRTHDAPAGQAWSRLIELDPLTREIVWEYRAEPPEAFCSTTRGTVQRLPNGNTLVGASNQGRVFEVTPDGSVVWDYRTPHRDEKGRRAVLRTARYESAFIDSLDSR